MPRLKVYLLNMGVFLGAMVILAIFLEGVLALVQINQKSNLRLISGKGVTHIPGAYYRHTKEGFSQGYFNSHGFRDYERTYQKTNGTFRILILGDSYVEALQVALEDSFPSLLEETLNANFAPLKFEVVNLGHSGFGTADEYMRYVNFGVKYSPDLVVLAFLTGNDFRNNSKLLNREALAFYFDYNDKGNLVLDKSNFEQYEKSTTLPKRLFQNLKRYSYLASLISERIYLLRRQNLENNVKAEFIDGILETEGSGLDQFSDLSIYAHNLAEPWKRAIDITKDLILKFREEVEKNNAGFVVVSLSNAEQVHPRIREQVTKRYGNIFDFEQPERILEEFAKKKKIKYLKLMPIFRDYHLQTGLDLHGFQSSGVGHWNENGHRLAAEEIYKFLVQSNLLPVSPRKPT